MLNWSDFYLSHSIPFIHLAVLQSDYLYVGEIIAVKSQFVATNVNTQNSPQTHYTHYIHPLCEPCVGRFWILIVVVPSYSIPCPSIRYSINHPPTPNQLEVSLFCFNHPHHHHHHHRRHFQQFGPVDHLSTVGLDQKLKTFCTNL